MECLKWTAAAPSSELSESEGKSLAGPFDCISLPTVSWSKVKGSSSFAIDSSSTSPLSAVADDNAGTDGGGPTRSETPLPFAAEVALRCSMF